MRTRGLARGDCMIADGTENREDNALVSTEDGTEMAEMETGEHGSDQERKYDCLMAHVSCMEFHKSRSNPWNLPPACVGESSSSGSSGHVRWRGRFDVRGRPPRRVVRGVACLMRRTNEATVRETTGSAFHLL